ncbi:MAG: hypothetical protein WKF88_07695 [Ferruginibacter sp.]
MKAKSLLQDISLWGYIFFGAIGLGATVYQMMVIVPEFERDIPHGMTAFAQSHVEPRDFWTSPILNIGYLLVIITLVANWKTKRRKWLVLSIAFMIAASIFTMLYFIPRLKIMGILDDKASTDLTLLTQTIKEWIITDKVRFWLTIVPAFFFALKAATVHPTESRQKSIA